MLIIKGFQYFRSIILFILGFLPNKESWSFNSVIALINYKLYSKQKTHFFFHLSPSCLKRLIHRGFSGEGFISQPITASITYHLSPSSYPTFAFSSPHLLQFVFHCLETMCFPPRETKCFITWNKLFQVLEL